MKSLLSGFVVVVLCVSAVASVSFAQLPTGTILGVVKDNSGGVVPAANITIRNTDTGQTRTVTTGDDGAYRMPALLVGHYSVRFEKSGFNTETQTGLTLEVTQELVVNATLQVGTSSQEVVVTGEAPVVNTTSGTLGGLVNEEKMTDLPLNGRNWMDLTLMQAGITQQRVVSGVSPVANTGTFVSSNGASIRSNNYMLDGAMMVTLYGVTQSSVSGSTLGVEGIKEYKVVTNGFSADYGLTMGSQMTLVSKNGTNTWHGSAFEYIRNSAMDAQDFFNTPLASGKTLAGAQRRIPPFKRNNFGGSFGGPIRKDKTFFFAVFEGVQERKGLSLVGNALGDGTNGTTNCRAITNNPCTSPVGGTVSSLVRPFLGLIPAGTVGAGQYYLPLPNLPNTGTNPQIGLFTFPVSRNVSEQYGQIRLDQTFSDKDTAFARYTINHATLLQPNLANPSPYLVDHPYNTAQYTTVSETHIFNTSTLNTARFSISRTPLENTSPTPDYPGAGGALVSFIPGFPQFGLGTFSVTGLTSISADLQLHHDQKIYAVSDDVFWTKGRHSFKFGTLITNWKQRMELQGSLRGSLSFTSVPNLLSNVTTGLLQGPVYNSYSGNTPGSNVRRDYTSGTMGYYAQDDIRLTSRLTVNTGLRYEFLYPNFEEKNGLGSALRDIVNDSALTPGPTLKNPSLKAFSPRLGFAWDVRGNGKTSLRGGGSLLYDIGNLGAGINQAAAGTPPASSQSSVTYSTAAGSCAVTAGALTIPFNFPSCALGRTLALVDYNLKQAHILVYNLTAEQQLPGGIGLTVAYAGSRGFNLYNRREGNPCFAENADPTTHLVPASIGVSNWANASNTRCPLGRANTHFDSITFISTGSDSWFNSLQIGVNKRVSHGIQFTGNYTWSKNLDDGNGQQPGDNNTFTIDPQFPKADKGPAGWDVTSNFRFNVIYHLPNMSKGGFVGRLVNGWWMSSIVSAQTGYPFTPSLSANRSLSGALTNQADRPNLAPGRTVSSITSGFSTANGIDPCPTAGEPLGTPTLWFDPCAFVLQAPGFLGNVSRGLLRGPHLSNVDLSVSKDTPLRMLGESGQLQFRAEIFNILNHPNFVNPSGTTVYSGTNNTPVVGTTNYIEVPQSTAGQILTSSTTSRQVQLALKIVF